jgi:sulfatase modifying factor 1
MPTAIRHSLFTVAVLSCTLLVAFTGANPQATAQQPAQGQVRTVDLGNNINLEVLYLPPGEFMMGSTPEERSWATGIEGGATPGTTRESFEGEARLTRIRHGLWMARTEVSVGQFRRFVEDSGYVTDAEKPGGRTQCFDPSWTGYQLTTSVVHPWSPMPGKSWRDPNWAFPQQDNFPVVCVSWNDGRAFCRWLTDRERAAGRLGTDLEYRLPTDAEWEYACRGGKPRAYFWWGNELEDGEGRLNISAIDLLPGRTRTWPLAKAPWSDGYSFVSPVDHFGERGRNGFGLADMCGGVWEVVLDHFDPKGGHEEPIFNPADPHPVCRGGNYFDVPGNARCAVRLGLQSDSYSDSRDGFRICLGKPIAVPEKITPKP